MWFKPGTPSFFLMIALVIVVILIIVTSIPRRRKENFSFGNIFKKIADVGKTVGNTVKNTATNVVDKIGGGGGPTYQPIFSGGTWNGRTWACAGSSLETGLGGDRTCLVSDFGPQVWKADDNGNWGWNCPRGSTPNNSGDWNQKCQKGFMGRIQMNGVWQCPSGTQDTGKDWSTTSDWYEAQKQCQIFGNYTQRYFDTSKQQWVCPNGYRDTGFNWGDRGIFSTDGTVSDAGANQCQLIP